MIKNSQNRSFLFKNRVKLKSHFYYKNLTAVTMRGIMRGRKNKSDSMLRLRSTLKVGFNEISGMVFYVNSHTKKFSDFYPPPEGAYKFIPLYEGSDAGCIVFNSPNKGVVIEYRI